MIGLDTNVLLRLLLNDDPPQAQAARKFLKAHCSPEHPGFVGHIALCEFAWTLERTYDLNRVRIASAIDALVNNASLKIEMPDQVAGAVEIYRRTPIGFSDALMANVNSAQGCSETATFDRKAARTKWFRLVS